MSWQSETILFQNSKQREKQLKMKMLHRLRNSQKYYEKQNTFHIGANKWFLTEEKNNILSLFAKAILKFVGCFHFPQWFCLEYLELLVFTYGM